MKIKIGNPVTGKNPVAPSGSGSETGSKNCWRSSGKCRTRYPGGAEVSVGQGISVQAPGGAEVGIGQGILVELR